MDQKNRILFVCLGNICRSPLAEGIFTKKIKEKDLLKYFEVDSCGTSNYHIGDQPDQRTRENALKHNVNLFHKARQLTYDDLSSFDYILAMDENNLKEIRLLDKNDTFREKIFLMRAFETNTEQKNVPDPYFGGEEGFENVFNILDRSIDGFINYFLQLKNS